LALHRLLDRGVEACHAMALHRRAGDDTARPVNRRHGASCATRGAVLVSLAVRRPHGPGLADPGRRLGVLRDQVPGRVRDDVGRLPGVLPLPPYWWTSGDGVLSR